jgi:hypothetical protein
MPAPRKRRIVLYLHHTRDRDGEVIFYFHDPQIGVNGAVMQSSPVVHIRRSFSAVLDRHGRGDQGKYIICTTNTDYEVQMSREKGEHLAMELGVRLPGMAELPRWHLARPS